MVSCSVMSVLTCGSTGTEKVYSNKYPVTGQLQGGNISSESLPAMTVETLTLQIHRSNGTSPNTEVRTRL